MDLFRLLKRPAYARAVRKPGSRRTALTVEALESRLVPYSVTGDAWPHANLVTISFVPDGTVIGANNNGPVTSNLISVFNAKFGSAAKWQSVILKAAQSWAQQTNLNFVLVSDNGASLGSGNNQQGDPGFGDIRISGYNIGSNILGMAAMPPPDNNYSIAGDIALNTATSFNIGATYDLFSVAAHEIGHAIGLDHSSLSSAVMYANYTSTKSALSSDDISGGRNIYDSNAARAPDRFDAAGGNNSFGSATNLTSQISPSSLTALVSGLDITTTSDVDYYQFTAPANSSSNLTVTAQSQGLSLLAPTLTVYNANQTQLASVSGAGQYGTTLTATVGGLVPGQTYYVKVAGADTSAFGTGAYALTLNLGTGTAPTVAAPNTTTANGSTPSNGGSLADTTSGGGGGGGLIGFLVHTVVTVVDDLLQLGSLVGLSTKTGLGAAIGDLYTAEDAAPNPATTADSSSDTSLPAPAGSVEAVSPVSAGETVKSSLSGVLAQEVARLARNPAGVVVVSSAGPAGLLTGAANSAMRTAHPGQTVQASPAAMSDVDRSWSAVVWLEDLGQQDCKDISPSLVPTPVPAAPVNGEDQSGGRAFNEESGRSQDEASEPAGAVSDSRADNGEESDDVLGRLETAMPGVAVILGAYWGVQRLAEEAHKRRVNPRITSVEHVVR